MMTNNDLSRSVDEIMNLPDSEKKPGCSLAVVHKGKPVFSKSYGLAILDNEQPIDGDTIFHAASVSKQFTAAAIHLLEMEGKLRLDDSIGTYIPELPAPAEPVTLDNLLHHTGGFRDQWELLYLTGWREKDPLSNDDVLNMISAQRELNFPPGSEYLYCTTGYTLLAIAVERISGMSFSSYCRQEIFAPLGMERTFFRDGSGISPPGRAVSYRIGSRPDISSFPLNFTTVGGTGLNTTVNDLCLWIREWHEKNHFPPELFSRMLSPGKLLSGEELSYGSGLVFRKQNGRFAYGHGGIDAGFRSYIITYPREELSVIILGNSSSLMPGALVDKIAALFIREEDSRAAAEELPGITTISETILRERAATYYCGKGAMTRTLEMRGGSLFLTLAGGLELEALSDSEMRIKERPFAKYRFIGSKMTETIGANEPAEYEKTGDPDRDCGKLEEYAGIYVSEELDLPYSVHSEKGSLFLTGKGTGRRKLIPAFPHGFIGEITPETDYLVNLSVIFEKNDDRIVRFRLNTRDVRNLQFTKER